MVTVSHQRHFIQHLKGGSGVATIVCFDLEVVWRHQGTWQVTRIVAALLAYLKASATAELQLLQLLSDLLLIFLQLPMKKGASVSCRSPPHPITFEGVLRVHTCSPSSLWVMACVYGFVLSFSPSLHVYLSFLTMQTLL